MWCEGALVRQSGNGAALSGRMCRWRPSRTAGPAANAKKNYQRSAPTTSSNHATHYGIRRACSACASAVQAEVIERHRSCRPGGAIYDQQDGEGLKECTGKTLAERPRRTTRSSTRAGSRPAKLANSPRAAQRPRQTSGGMTDKAVCALTTTRRRTGADHMKDKDGYTRCGGATKLQTMPVVAFPSAQGRRERFKRTSTRCAKTKATRHAQRSGSTIHPDDGQTQIVSLCK